MQANPAVLGQVASIMGMQAERSTSAVLVGVAAMQLSAILIGVGTVFTIYWQHHSDMSSKLDRLLAASAAQQGVPKQLQDLADMYEERLAALEAAMAVYCATNSVSRAAGAAGKLYSRNRSNP